MDKTAPPWVEIADIGWARGELALVQPTSEKTIWAVWREAKWKEGGFADSIDEGKATVDRSLKADGWEL